jgi:hypothetical protein
MEEKKMKTTSMTKKVTVVATCASLMLLTVGAWTAFAGGATLQENEAVWGKPISIQKLDNGAEKRFYKYQNSMAIAVPYFVYQDGKVIGEGLAVNAPDAQKAENKGLPFGTLSKDYYQNRQVTTQEVDAVWGKTVAVRALEDGSQERYYKYQNTADLGYRCFLVKNDKVVASAVARAIPASDKKEEAKGLPVNFVKEPGFATVADVEQTWGRPVSVKKLANGTEERFYKYGNTMLGDVKAMYLFKDGKVIGSNVAN